MIDKYIKICQIPAGHIKIQCLNDGILNFQNIYEGISRSGHPDFSIISGWHVSEEKIWEMRLNRSFIMFCPTENSNVFRKCDYFEVNTSFFKSIYRDRIEKLLVKFLMKNSFTLKYLCNFPDSFFVKYNKYII